MKNKKIARFACYSDQTDVMPAAGLPVSDTALVSRADRSSSAQTQGSIADRGIPVISVRITTVGRFKLDKAFLSGPI